MEYTTPEVVAQNNSNGSYAAGCPANDNGSGSWCTNCERSE